MREEWTVIPVPDSGIVDPNVVVDHGLSYGARETAARPRLDFYRQAGLRVMVGQDTQISQDFGGTSVRKNARASGSTDNLTNTLIIRIRADHREITLA